MNKMGKSFKWYNFLWIWSIVYFTLGFFNIFFAWLGLIDFITPILIATFGGGKFFCNHLCGRGQLFAVLGAKLKGKKTGRLAPKWLSSKYFRFAFLAFFLTMFANMVLQTILVAKGATDLKKVVKLLWTFKVPWNWAYVQGLFPDWVAQFSFGFYSLMLTSTIIGLVMMFIFRNRTWCTFCPMGTMTQLISKGRYNFKKNCSY